jgi:hypothetical protein
MQIKASKRAKAQAADWFSDSVAVLIEKARDEKLPGKMVFA